jgi:hypothetical protein
MNRERLEKAAQFCDLANECRARHGKAKKKAIFRLARARPGQKSSEAAEGAEETRYA